MVDHFRKFRGTAKAVLLVCLFLLPSSLAGATIIDLDATSADDTGTGVTLNLEAGDYIVTAIDGTFDAWNAWAFGDVSGCDIMGENCTHGWMTAFIISSASLGEIENGFSDRYESAALAIANPTIFMFSLTAMEDVTFRVGDFAMFFDNLGGISLQITKISLPEPGAILFLGAGLLLIAVVSRRRRAIRVVL